LLEMKADVEIENDLVVASNTRTQCVRLRRGGEPTLIPIDIIEQLEIKEITTITFGR